MKRRSAWALFVTATVAVIFRSLFFITIVDGNSMEPAFHSGQFLLMRRCADSAPLDRFDVVVARSGSEYVLKRIVGLPGEMVHMENGVLFVDGKQLNEPFPHLKGRSNAEPGLVPEGCYLLIGDNREKSAKVVLIVARSAIVARSSD